MAIGGAAAAAVGSLLPWATVTTFIGTISKNGTDGDGMITLIAAALACLLVLTGKSTKVALGLMVICAAVAVFDIGDVSSTSTAGVEASVGFGLWIVAVGAAASLYGLVQKLRGNR